MLSIAYLTLDRSFRFRFGLRGDVYHSKPSRSGAGMSSSVKSGTKRNPIAASELNRR